MSYSDETNQLPPAEVGAAPDDVIILARGTGLGLIGGVLREGLTALTMLVLARLLAQDQFGLMQLGISCAVILAVFGKAGINLVVSRFVAIYRATGEPDKVKGMIYGGVLWSGAFSVALAVGITVLAPWLGEAFRKPEFVAPLRAFVWWVPTASVTMVLVAAVLSRGSARARVMARDIAFPGLFLVFGTIAAVAWQKAWALGIAYSLASLVGMILAGYYVRRFFPRLGAVAARFESRLLLVTSFPLLLTDLAQVGLAQADVVVVGRLLAAGQVGIYAAAVHLALFGTLPLNALNQITAPVISRLYHQGKREELERLLKTFTRLTLMVSVPLTALMVGMATPVMGLLGPKFLPGAPALIIASVGVLFNTGTGSVSMALVMTGHQWLAFATNLGSVVLLIGLVWGLTPLYGITGAAMGLALATSLANLVRLGLVWRVIGVNPMSVAMVKSLAAGTVSGAVAWGMTRALGISGREGLHFLLPVLAAVSVIALVVYSAAIWLLGLEESDREAARVVGERLRGR